MPLNPEVLPAHLLLTYPGDVAPLTGSPEAPYIDPSEVLDASIQRGKIVFTLRDGTRIVTEKSEHAYKLYWHIKIRNRRTAFGL